MPISPATDSQLNRVAVGVTLLYSLLAAYYSFAANGGAAMLALCMVPYLPSAWTLIFTAPAAARASFAVAATAILAAFGAMITLSTDPKAGQLWWLLLLCIPLSAMGAGLAANYLNPRLSSKSRLWASLLAALVAGVSPYATLALLH